MAERGKGSDFQSIYNESRRLSLNGVDGKRVSPVAQMVKSVPEMWETRV